MNTRLLRWKNYHRGEECLLICNGPSLNQVEWPRIRAGLTRFGVNKIYLGEERFGFVPRYLCCVNEKVLRQSMHVLNPLPVVKFVSNRLSAQCYPENPLQYRINTQHLPKDAERFSPDICTYVEEGGTVTYAALQVIYYMGFARVFIVGMDHRFKRAVSGEENTTAMLEGDDEDHFDPRYFRGLEWDLPDLVESERSYHVAREAFERDGRSIVDCTVNGDCDVFDKRPIAALYA